MKKNEDTRADFAKALKKCRLWRNKTQEDFGIISSRTYISTLERGLKSPTLEKIEQLSHVLEVHPLTLLLLTYSKSSNEDDIDALLGIIRNEVKDSDLQITDYT
jgi:transcriptional regulator with XRE-family HTH domain